jgi:hypothetical protein
MTSHVDSLAPGRREGPDPQTEQRTVVATKSARQGVTGHNVRYVLGFGLAGIIIAFVAIYIIYFA